MTNRTRTYECMCLLDNGEVRKGWEPLKEAVAGLFTKHGAKILSNRRWDERRLAYPIEGHNRATYLLVYFAAEGNPSWLGPAPLVDMAAHIARSAGPSGPNAAYVVELDRALKALGVVDDHVAALAEAVRAVGSA